MVGQDEWGVADGYWGTDGQWRATSDDTRAALHSSLGADVHPNGPPAGPPTWFVHAGESPEVWNPGEIDVEDGGTVRVDDRLPPDLPLGGHLLRSDDGAVTRLFVVPHHGRPAPRTWGWSVQLYATRSGSSWGHGDLGDLAALATWAGDSGAGLVAHNPIGATVPVGPQQPSPYYASSRRFWSPLYLRVEDVPGAAAAASFDEARRAGIALNRERRIDRDVVWALKRSVLEEVWAETRSSPETVRRLESATHDAALDRHSAFCALAETYGPSWREWPAAYRHPSSEAVEAFAATNLDRLEFWRWLQLLTDEQLDRAAVAGAQLMADLPVGFDPDGADAWVDQDLLAADCRIGAPPDDLGPLGQDWGLPPYVPWKLREAAYEPWRATIRRTLVSAGALRIDHVMGLFRLFWIPPGTDARHGSYVYWPGTELLDLAVMEAVRAGAVLVGEDLGTVEPEVRTALAEREVYGYRVGWFEDDPPEEWPGTCVGSLTTHDLPTVRGVWSGTDAEVRADAGQPVDPHDDALLRGRLARLAGVESDEDLSSREVGLRAHRRLAHAGCDIVMATLEDAIDSPDRPNVPGTIDEHPNWSVALPVPIEALDDSGAADVALLMGDGVGRDRG